MADFNEFLDAKIAEAEAPAVEETPAPAPVVEAPAPEVSAPEAPAVEETEQDKFDRAYVEQLRKESAKYRERAKTFEGAFEGIAPEDREVFLALAKTYAQDPAAAVREMARIAEAYGLPSQQDEAGEPEVMTVEKYQEMRKQEAVEAQARAIAAEAKGLGYNPGTPEYQYLLAVAKTLPDGDLNQAHAQIKAREQAAVDAYLAKKAAEAQGTPAAPADAYAAPSGEKAIKSWADARAALDQMIEAHK